MCPAAGAQRLGELSEQLRGTVALEPQPSGVDEEEQGGQGGQFGLKKKNMKKLN
jgi:hypothetical protein